MGFSRQECWSGLPCPPPGDLPDPGIEPKCVKMEITGNIKIYKDTEQLEPLYTLKTVFYLG